MRPSVEIELSQDVKSLVVTSLADALGTDDFDLSTPLMELGLDSLAGVEFRNRLQERSFLDKDRDHDLYLKDIMKQALYNLYRNNKERI